MPRAAIAVLVAGCWTSPAETPRKAPVPEAKPAATEELRAMVRIDAKPGGKGFQGVWLELDGDRRWVIDYRPREVWRSFEDEAVLVTGHCYRPAGQAIMKPHFQVDRLRLAPGSKQVAPFVEVGPEITLRGTFVETAAPAGSKASEWNQPMFRADGGDTYWIAAASDTTPAAGTAASIHARRVVRSKTYAAAPGGEHIWVVSVRDEDDPRTAPKPAPCPN